jgi:hypothetical protein
MLDKEARRQRRGMKFVYIMDIAFYLIAAIIMIYLSVNGFIPLTLSEESAGNVNTAQILLIVVSLIFLIVGLFWPYLARWHKKEHVNYVELGYGHVVRATFLGTPVIYGFVLFICGSWYIVTLIYVLSLAALIWTFPTDKRLAKWRGE